MKKLLPIIFIVAFVVALSIGTAGIAFANDAPIVEETAIEDAPEQEPTLAENFRIWWSETANKEITIFGMTLTISAALGIVLAIVWKIAKAKIKETATELIVQKKISAEYETSLNALSAKLDAFSDKYIKQAKDTVQEQLNDEIAAAEVIVEEAKAKVVKEAESVKEVAFEIVRPVI